MSKYATTIPETKDNKRLADIKTKSAGNMEKAVSLATSMANKITDRDKASRRKYAADTYFGEDSEVSRVFENRYNELNPDSMKKSSLIDKILEAFDYKSGCIWDLETNSKVELDLEIEEGVSKVTYFEPRQAMISSIAVFEKLPDLEVMWQYRNIFSGKKTVLDDITKYEFTL